MVAVLSAAVHAISAPQKMAVEFFGATFLMAIVVGYGIMADTLAGGNADVFLAHAMFDQEIIQHSMKVRSGVGQWISEGVATFGVICVIITTMRAKPDFVPIAVGLYITGAYWFTASTSFANPAVTFARSFTNTFSGIRPEDVLAFALVQFAAAALAHISCRFLMPPKKV